MFRQKKQIAILIPYLNVKKQMPIEGRDVCSEHFTSYLLPQLILVGAFQIFFFRSPYLKQSMHEMLDTYFQILKEGDI